jgi:hypothetical protein
MLHTARQAGALADLVVAYRFIEAGRLVAWPLVPCAYDLVVDGGSQVSRVRVKRAMFSEQDSQHGAAYRVRLTRRKGKGPDQPIALTDFDYLAVVCQPERIYVIPVEALRAPTNPQICVARLSIGAVQSQTHEGFLNRFTIGSGLTTEIQKPTSIYAVRPGTTTARGWAHPTRATRKPHRRLTGDEAVSLRSGVQGGLSLQDAARQFGITYATARNLVLGKRKDFGRSADLADR